MTELIKPTRAKSVSIAVERVDAVGKRKNARTRNHIVPLAGMMSGKEAEKMGRNMARDLGVSEDRVNVELYKNGDAPMEANPVHRGGRTRWERGPTSAPREITPKPFQRVRKVFSGNMPKTPAEWAQHVREFEERKLNGSR